MIRNSQIYVTRETRRLLSVIARSEGGEATADSVGERCLFEYITSRYPGLTALQNKIEEIETQMVEEARR